MISLWRTRLTWGLTGLLAGAGLAVLVVTCAR